MTYQGWHVTPGDGGRYFVDKGRVTVTVDRKATGYRCYGLEPACESRTCVHREAVQAFEAKAARRMPGARVI